jgi:hypothetical protein
MRVRGHFAGIVGGDVPTILVTAILEFGLQQTFERGSPDQPAAFEHAISSSRFADGTAFVLAFLMRGMVRSPASCSPAASGADTVFCGWSHCGVITTRKKKYVYIKMDFKRFALVYCDYRITFGTVITVILVMYALSTIAHSRVKGTTVGNAVQYTVKGTRYTLPAPPKNTRTYPYVIYNPQNPADASLDDITPAVMWLLCVAVLVSLLTWYYRANPWVCGATIASDVLAFTSPVSGLTPF